MPREPRYTINGLSLQKYLQSVHHKITATDNWQGKTEEIVAAINEIAPSVPRKVLRQAYMKRRKIWMTVSDEQFNNLFDQA